MSAEYRNDSRPASAVGRADRGASRLRVATTLPAHITEVRAFDDVTRVTVEMTDLPTAMVEGIAATGYAIIPDAVGPDPVTALRDRALALDACGEFVAAGIGRGASRTARSDIRGDRIRWLDEAHPAAAEVIVWRMVDALRDALNRNLLLGVWSFEGHYALYPPGARYARHRDRFRDDDARVVSCILYLNEQWRVEDGGALRLYTDDGHVVEVMPQGGTMVAFLAERFDHEVLAATRTRLALTGWFRRREFEM